jgi:hypothetical protein
MKPWIAHAIASNGPSLGWRRGMFGKETAAVTGSLPAFIAAAASAARELADEQLAEEFLDALAAVRIDQMGRESVFY